MPYSNLQYRASYVTKAAINGQRKYTVQAQHQMLSYAVDSQT